MMKLLIAILYLVSAASSLNISEVINSTKTYMELPLVKANKFATKALLKVLWFTTERKEGEELYNGLEKDMAVVKEIMSTTRIRSEEEFFAELMKKSPDLGARMKNMYDLRKKQLAELKPEVQAFAENITEFMGSSMFLDMKALPSSVGDKLILGLIEKFNALSDDAKKDIQEKFPVLAELTSEEATKRPQEH